MIYVVTLVTLFYIRSMQMSVEDYAKLIGKSKMTVYRWIEKDNLPTGVKVKKCCGITKLYVKDK